MTVERRITYSLDDLDKVVSYLQSLMDRCKVFAFSGSLGAGKTTLVKALLKACGVKATVQSPTFSYVNVHHNDKGQTFYHFDLYRITSVDEFIAQGFDEMLYQDESWAFIEWPEVIEPLLNEQICHVVLDYATLGQRRLTCDVITTKERNG